VSSVAVEVEAWVSGSACVNGPARTGLTWW